MSYPILVAKRVARTLLVASLASAFAQQAAVATASDPKVAFDVSYVVACRDITPEEFAVAHPGRRLIEAHVQVSVRLLEGREEGLHEIVVEITSPERRLHVVDFAPKTEVTSEIEGTFQIVETKEEANSLEASLGGNVALEYGLAKGQAAPRAGAAHTSRQLATETYHRLPPKQLLLAAGTMNRQHGVFFKLKPSSQASLEGVHEFRCHYLVPDTWRGDWIEVACRARTPSRRYLTDNLVSCGACRVRLGLYLEGDVAARTAALHVARTQAGGEPDGERNRTDDTSDNTKPAARSVESDTVPDLFGIAPLVRLCSMPISRDKRGAKKPSDAQSAPPNADPVTLALEELAALSGGQRGE